MADMELRKSFPTIFGSPMRNKSIVFAIDTSGSMYNKLEIVKSDLIQFLLNLAMQDNVSFNILEFNSEIRCWSDKMVACSHSTVEVAIPWIKSLTPQTGTNTLDALLTAFENDCDCIYLVTDGLPDQHPFDIIDEVVYTSNHRPVHSIYLTGDSSDASAIRFLEDLATETYGTFLMATIVRYGVLDKITPIYRADLSKQKMVRSSHGNMLPANNKLCSVTTSLHGSPVHGAMPAVSADGYVVPVPYMYEPYWWTRYHAAKSFMKSHVRLGNEMYATNPGISPSAAVMLIGQKVISRCEDDGYYYLGTANSQLSTEVFLVEFHACKVGDYKETQYQETRVYDIISFTDALRHPILPGDKVLAPIVDGKFGPAIVIGGMEYRGSTPGIDAQITVSYSDGRTRDLSANSAIWIPGPLYDRISLELKLPKSAQKPLKDITGYPGKSLPGYPLSGYHPAAYTHTYPSMVDCGDVLLDCSWFGWPRMLGVHSAMYKPQGRVPVTIKASQTSESIEKNVKIAEPLTIEDVKEEEVEEVKEVKDIVEEVKEEEEVEEKISEEEYQELLRDILDDEEKEETLRKRIRSFKPYQPWKNHWKTEPIPPLPETCDGRPGPFRETALCVPMELREQRLEGENFNSHFTPTRVHTAPKRFETSIHRMQALPHPQPSACSAPPVRRPPPPAPQTEAVEFTQQLGESQVELEQKVVEQRDHRRHRILQREDERVNKMMSESRMYDVMTDYHRERVQDRMNQERDRQTKHVEDVQSNYQARRQIAMELRDHVAEKARLNEARAQQRLDARRNAQVQRGEAEVRRREDLDTRALKERNCKEARSQERWQQRHQQLGDTEKQQILRNEYLRGVKVGRREHFRRLEAESQNQKDLRDSVLSQNQAVFKSAIAF